MVPRRKSRASSEPTSDQISLTRIHYSTGTVRLSEMPIIDSRILPGTTQDSNTKTLRNMLLLRCLQLYSTILIIRGSGYAARSSICSKRYNAPISIQDVIDSSGYLCMARPTIKRPQENHNVTMTAQAGINTPPSPSRRGWLRSTTSIPRDCNRSNCRIHCNLLILQ